MVRQTVVLHKIKFAFEQRKVFKRKAVYTVQKNAVQVPLFLKEKGTKIVSANKLVNPPPEPWEPPSQVLPDFRWKLPPKPLEKRQNYHEKPICHVSNQISFTEGIDQACILTKTQKFNGLPPQLEKNLDKYSIKDQNTMVQRIIMQAQVWDPTLEKLPKRIDFENMKWGFPREYGIPDTRSGSILLNNLIRLCQSMGGQFPALSTERRHVFKPSVDMVYNFKGEPIQIKAVNECLIAGKRPLPPFGDAKLIKASVDHKLLDMYPILPTIDLLQTHVYVLRNEGAFKETMGIECSHPQTVFRITGQSRREEYNQAYNLMTTFAVALAEARNKYGELCGPLPEPITIQNVNCTFQTYNYLCFQLNTTDLDTDDGIKNFAWFDTNNRLFNKQKAQPWKEENFEYKPTNYFDYDPAMFKKLLAMYLYSYV